MKINLIPVFSSSTLILEKRGDVLTVNGEAFDFSPLKEGSTLSDGSVASDFIVGEVNRENNELILNVVLPWKVGAGESSRFPSPLHDILDGRVVLPTDFDIPEESL